MSQPGSGAAEYHGFELHPDGRATPVFDPNGDPTEWGAPLPAVAEGWLPESDPLGGAGNGTGPHEFPLPADSAEPAVGDPGQVMAAVAAGQPGTWPTSLLDLDNGPPEPAAETPDTGPELPVPAPEPAGGGMTPNPVMTPNPAGGAGAAFSAVVRVDPTEDTGSFELTATGSAAFVSRLLEEFATAFLFEMQSRTK